MALAPVALPMPSLLTVDEAAKVLRLSRAKTYQLISRGALRAVRIDGARRVRPSDLAAYIESLAA